MPGKLPEYTCTEDGEWSIPTERNDASRTYLAIDNPDRIIGHFAVGLRCSRIMNSIPTSDKLTRELNIDKRTGKVQMYLIGDGPVLTTPYRV